MVEIKKIMVNIQFDATSLKAINLAKDLAEKYKSQLVVFHEIVDVYIMKKVAVGFGVPFTPDLEEKSKNNAKSKIEDLLNDFKGDLKIIIDISGEIKKVLPKFLQEEKPDLLILTDDYEYLIKNVDVNTLIVK